ncbi:hypothetical protein SAMN05444162_4133 [Paenibacillaceae bacterium GAS479]|nr:hypothetical protein SAMN05444162_4133 [Paenibacillaceae bacterium GAS479]
MKVYRYENSSKNMILAGDTDDLHPLNSRFNGDSKLDIWYPIKVETLYKRTYNDFPKYIIGKPIFSEKVKELTESFISDEVEFLPLGHKDMNLFAVNVTKVLDCVDWDRSDIRTFNDGSFAGFNKLVFDFSKIPPNTYIFKYKERAMTQVYVTDLFKELVEKHKLKGLDFSEVFDPEFTEEKEREQQRAFDQRLAEIEQNKGPEISFDEARALVDHGHVVESGKWRMKLNSKGQFVLGELLQDLSYQWMKPVYIPPILLGYDWCKVEE